MFQAVAPAPAGGFYRSGFDIYNFCVLVSEDGPDGTPEESAGGQPSWESTSKSGEIPLRSMVELNWWYYG